MTYAGLDWQLRSLWSTGRLAVCLGCRYIIVNVGEYGVYNMIDDNVHCVTEQR